MTHNEFDRWWADLTIRFPSVEAWLLRAAPDETSQRVLLRTWYEVLRDVNGSDALVINKQMQCGDSEFVIDFHEQDLPKHVLRLARQLAWERDGRRESEVADYKPLEGGSGFPAKQILLRWRELERHGFSRDEARAKALEEFPVGTSTHREPRYACLTCLDSGRVLVASNAAIESMLLGTFDACHHRDAVMRCACHVGQRLVRKHEGRDIPWATYNEAADFKIADTLWREPERQRFAEWVDAQRDKRAEAMAATCANYEKRFDQFNQREAF